MWIDCLQSPCRCKNPDHCMIWFGAHTNSHWSYQATSRCSHMPVNTIHRLLYLARLWVWALPASHTGSRRETCVIYQGERMTARTLIVNHWQHYWTSSPSPVWICVGKLEETVINQPITHKRVCTEIFPQCTEAKALYFTLHMHTHIRIYNKCADKLGRDRSFSYVDQSLC